MQTVKSKRTAGGAGLFAQDEVECPAPGGRLALDGPDPTGVYAAIAEAAGEAPLAPVFETRVERLSERLRLPDGALVELALDRGEVVAGEARAPILEAEIELVEGEVGAVFALRAPAVPDRTGALRDGQQGGARLPAGARGRSPSRRHAEAAQRWQARLRRRRRRVETAARDVFRDCFAQIAENLVVVAAGPAIEGPHQLRIGLRRLRTAFAVFAPALGADAFAPLSAAARHMGQRRRSAARHRRADRRRGPPDRRPRTRRDGARGVAGRGARSATRRGARGGPRRPLAGPEHTAFLFDLLEFIETRGWLAPSDYSQTGRLATPLAEVAPAMLRQAPAQGAQARARASRRWTTRALHELRKELKKLRYAIETLEPVGHGKKAADYLKPLKAMQDTFGSLNDAAMAAEALAGPEAPGRADPDAQRGAGWVLGALAVRVADDRPALFAAWKNFARARPFWD